MGRVNNPRRTTERRVSQSEGRSRPSFISYHASRQNLATSSTTATRQAVAATGGAQTSVTRNPLHVALAVLVALVVLYSLTLSSTPEFTVRNPSGLPRLRPIADYENETRAILNESIMNMTKLTLDPAEVAKKVQDRHPELESVEVVLPFFGRTPKVEAVTARPVLQLVTSDDNYLINSKGRAVMRVDQAPKSIKDLNLPLIQDQADLDIAEGKGVLSIQDVKFITTLLQQFKSRELTPTSIELPPLATELHVRVSGKPYYIKFSLLTDARVAAGQYFALDSKLAKDSVMPKEYIDSRIEGKIYYK